MAEKGFAFAFVEGALVKAVREGWWLLLDEINLAPAEVPCHALPCPALRYPTLPYPTLPYPTLTYPTLPYPTLPLCGLPPALCYPAAV